jgi:hypothetical protein
MRFPEHFLFSLLQSFLLFVTIIQIKKEGRRCPLYSADYLSRYPFFRDVLQNVPLNVMHDALTGLVARSYILRFIQSLIHDETPFSLIIIDLDNFKSINDNYATAPAMRCSKA